MLHWTIVRPPPARASLTSYSFDYSRRRQRGSAPAEAAAEPAKPFLEARFSGATGVLVGQSGGMKNSKYLKSWSSHSRATRPKIETTNIDVSESGDDPESYVLTRVSREGTVRAQCIMRTRGNAIVVRAAAFLYLSRGTRRIIFVERRFVRVNKGLVQQLRD